MSIKNFFARSIRGWLPEEPKMPKSILRRILPPIAVFVAATTFVSFFSSSFFVANQTAVLLPPPAIVPSAPNSSYVELGGVTNENCSFILVLADGNHIFSEKLTLTFSLTDKGGDTCTARLAVECDGFSKEASVDGSIVDGNLVIDSRRSLFLINPNLTQNRIVLTETDDWELNAIVSSKTRKVPTSVDHYGVTTTHISSTTSRTAKGWPLRLDAGYDPNTGILVYSGMSLSDVLLEKLGIDLLLGGSLKLVSYSENLNFDIKMGKYPSGLAVLFPYFLLNLSISLCFILYFVQKKWRRSHVGAHNVLELNDNIGQSCEVGD